MMMLSCCSMTASSYVSAAYASSEPIRCLYISYSVCGPWPRIALRLQALSLRCLMHARRSTGPWHRDGMIALSHYNMTALECFRASQRYPSMQNQGQNR